ALPAVAAVVELLTPAGQTKTAALPELTMVAAEQLTAKAKTLYQSSRYQEALAVVPTLVPGLLQLAAISSAQEQLLVRRLLAHTYPAPASVLIKVGDGSLSILAAQRALDAASLSEDPVTSACSARSMTHALMNACHGDRALTLAEAVAMTLRHSPAGNT